MDHSDFVAADGTVWHIFAGLPPDYPDTGDRSARGGPQAGLTFRSGTGEVRVLPRAAIPRRAPIPADLSVSHASRLPTPRIETPGWEELLRLALSWRQPHER